jgi:hypothetical protein
MASAQSMGTPPPNGNSRPVGETAAVSPPTTVAPPPIPPAPEPAGLTTQQKAILIGIGIAALLVLVLLIWGAVYLVNNPAQAATVRDVFIIFMALETLLVGSVLIVLMLQLAVLTNLLKNEIKPILEATQETVNTVRGTTIFVSENLTEPIMKLNSYVAGLSRIVETLNGLVSIFRRF